MSLNLNTVVLAGHLTRDPEMRPLAGDKVVVSFSLAINRRFKSPDGEIKEDSTFVDCEAWGRTAELIGQYLAKGSAAYVEGRLKLDNWQDKEGQKKSRLKVVVDNVQFLGAPKNKTSTTDGVGAPIENPGTSANTASNANNGNSANAISAAKPRTPGRAAVGLDEPPF
jgi:single-strand DNA-binding protein